MCTNKVNIPYYNVYTSFLDILYLQLQAIPVIRMRDPNGIRTQEHSTQTHDLIKLYSITGSWAWNTVCKYTLSLTTHDLQD
jgi:hypothetical protein